MDRGAERRRGYRGTRRLGESGRHPADRRMYGDPVFERRLVTPKSGLSAWRKNSFRGEPAESDQIDFLETGGTLSDCELADLVGKTVRRDTRPQHQGLSRAEGCCQRASR